MPSKMELRQDEAFRHYLYRAAAAWEHSQGILEAEMADGTTVTEIRIQGPNYTGSGFRAIIKGRVGQEKVVAFHNADSLQDLLAGIVARAQSDGLTWRDDAPYVPRQPNARAHDADA